MAVKTFNAKLVVITFNGIILNGFAEDDICEIERNNPISGWVKGPQNESSRYLTNDTSGTITVYLQQDSEANKALKALVVFDETTGLGLGTISVFDANEGDSYIGNDSSIEKPAKVKFGRGLNGREWKFECPDLQFK